MSDTRKARLAQAGTVLRNHPGWPDEMVAGICGLTEREVTEVRDQITGAA
jgi:hypothetical protein